MLVKLNLPAGYLFRLIRKEAIGVSLYILLISLLDEYFEVKNLSIPIAIPTILGTAISLILGFRTNEAYIRWWEARQIWGAIVNDSRTWARQVITFIKDADEEEVNRIQRKMIHRQIAWIYSLGAQLRKTDPLINTQEYLDDVDEVEVQNSNNPANTILLQQGRSLARLTAIGKINQFQQVQMENTLSSLTDNMGKCERIKNTPFPTLYTYLVHAFIYLFVILLPFGLIETLGYVEIPIGISIALIFFSLERSAILLQDPFEGQPTDTPVTAIAQTIERNLRQMMNEQQKPEEAVKDTYYIM
jgi:putative membrane protein